MKKSKRIPNIMINIMFCLGSLVFILPFVLIISASFSDEQTLLSEGYKLIPSVFSTEAYKYVFRNPQQLLDSYKVTIIYSIVATVLGVVVMAMLAYPLSRPNYKYKKIATFFIFFTMLFSGGLIPTYIWITRYLHLGDTIWVYILPCLVNAFHVIVIRSFFQGLPQALMESAKIDGASELQTFFKIVMPLSKPVLSAAAINAFVQVWNTYLWPKLIATREEMYTIQVGIEQLNSHEASAYGVIMAAAVIALIPTLLFFIAFQKQIIAGMVTGSTKE